MKIMWQMGFHLFRTERINLQDLPIKKHPTYALNRTYT